MKWLIAILLAASGAATAASQIPGAVSLAVGTPAQGKPSTQSVADIYYFVGEAGARETYSFAGKGPASLTLFGPDGSEILTASGSGSVKLEVVLPFIDVFTLAVARMNPAAPYTLSREATVPTLAEQVIAGSVGYSSKDGRSRCWVIPGVRMRFTVPGFGKAEYTLAADRDTISFVEAGKQGTSTFDTTYRYKGATLHRTRRYPDGKVEEGVTNSFTSYYPDVASRYTGYECGD